MFVGHALLAFALVGALARRVSGPQRALVLAAVAGAYAAVPDVDILYAPVGVVVALAAGTADPFALAGAFWSTGNLVHRAITHSLVVAPVAALAVGRYVAARRSGRRPIAGPALLAGIVAVAVAVSGLLGGVVAVAFALAGLAIAEAVVRRTSLRWRTVAGLALIGLASHPFGDLLTGQPPALLYPLPASWSAQLVAERVTLHPDPTLHLLAAFAVELATVWAGVVVFLVLDGRLRAVGLRTLVPRASVGVLYAAAVFVLPAPTLELSYPFVFAVLAVSVVGLLPRIGRLSIDATVDDPPVPASAAEPDDEGESGSGSISASASMSTSTLTPSSVPAPLAPGVDAGIDLRLHLLGRESAVLTALTAISVAWAAYTVAYLLIA